MIVNHLGVEDAINVTSNYPQCLDARARAQFLGTHQHRIEALKARFLAHFENPQGVSITREGLLSVDFVNKVVDTPLFSARES